MTSSYKQFYELFERCILCNKKNYILGLHGYNSNYRFLKPSYDEIFVYSTKKFNSSVKLTITENNEFDINYLFADRLLYDEDIKLILHGNCYDCNYHIISNEILFSIKNKLISNLEISAQSASIQLIYNNNNNFVIINDYINNESRIRSNNFLCKISQSLFDFNDKQKILEKIRKTIIFS